MSLADVGLRFYPVASDAYGFGDDRPERSMRVELGDLQLAVDEQTIEEEGQAPRTVARIEGVTCLVRARVEKRRSDAPALVVGSGEAQGRVRHAAGAEELAGAPAHAVRAEAAGHEGLRVQEQDLLDAFEKGTVDALRALVKAVDRDLAAGN
jgi:hypothetical protein